MSKVFTNLTTNSSTTDATSFTTASIAPTDGNLLIAVVCGVAVDNVNPTLSGHGLTWKIVKTVGGAGSTLPNRVLRVFVAVSDGTSGTLTIDWGAKTQARCFWSVTEISGIPAVSVDGLSAIIQAVPSERANGGGAITSYSVTLDSFARQDNVVFGAIHNSSASSITAGSGFTELGDTTQDTQVLQTEYKLTPDTIVDWSFSSVDSDNLAIAIEIGEGVAGNSPMLFEGGLTLA